MADYSIWVVEYARVTEFARGLLLYGQWNTGTTIAPYCYAVLKSDDHLAVIDSGYDHVEFGKVLADSYGVSDWQPPEVVLGHLGFSPDDVDTLVLTHNHFDHAGGVEFFPNARVYFQEREISKYLWAVGLPDRLQWLTSATDPDLMLWLVNRMKQGKLTLLSEETEILPGVRCIPAHDTHTAGSQYVTVENEREPATQRCEAQEKRQRVGHHQSRWMIPRRSAIVTAWVRSAAPSFCRMFWTWIFMVPSARPRAVAISGLDFPSAIKRSTSISRGVSPMRGV